MGVVLRYAKNIMRRMRRRRRKRTDKNHPKQHYQPPPLTLIVRDSDDELQLTRLRHTLNWHTNARTIVLQMGESTDENTLDQRYTAYSDFRTSSRLQRPINDESLFLLFATLGQLPILSRLAINGSNPKYPPMVRVRDLAMCLKHATQLETLKLSEVHLVALELREWDCLVEAILGLRYLKQMEVFHVPLQSVAYSGEYCLWDRILVACSFLPCLKSFHIIANKYGHVSPASLRALSRAPSLEDVMLIHLHLEQEHILALTHAKWRELTLICQWNADMAKALASCIEHQNTLETLNLSLETNHLGEADETAKYNLATSENLSKLIHGLAHNTSLRNVRLTGAHIEDSDPMVWKPLWICNFVLQSLVVPRLNQGVQTDLDFWIKTLNRAGRWLLWDADTVNLEVWIQLFTHPRIKDDIQALFYLLSAIHPYLISKDTF